MIFDARALDLALRAGRHHDLNQVEDMRTGDCFHEGGSQLCDRMPSFPLGHRQLILVKSSLPVQPYHVAETDL